MKSQRKYDLRLRKQRGTSPRAGQNIGTGSVLMDIALSACGHYNPCKFCSLCLWALQSCGVLFAFCGYSPTHLDMFKRIKKHPNMKHGLLNKSGKKNCECQ